MSIPSISVCFQRPIITLACTILSLLTVEKTIQQNAFQELNITSKRVINFRQLQTMLRTTIFQPRGLELAATLDLEKPWYLTELIKYFSSTPYAHCFESPWTCEKTDPTWIPKAPLKSVEYVNAVNTWIFLSENVESHFIQRCLFSLIDRHMCNIKQVDGQGLFQCTYVSDYDLTDYIIPSVIMDVLPPSKPTKDKKKILHALSKALPARCQIRNLREILVNYVSESDTFFHFLLKVLKNSLFGIYPHCKCRLNFKGRFILHDSFKKQLSSKPFFCKWFRSGEHQVLVFFCLKEFLIHAVRQASPCFEVIDKKFGWAKFDEQVQSFMSRIRERLNILAEREFHFLVRSDWIVNIESILLNASKQHIKLFRTTQLVTYYSKIHSLIIKHFTTKNEFNIYDIVTTEMTHFIWSIIQRLYRPENIFKVLHIFGVPLNVADMLMEQSFGQEHFQEQSDKTLKIVLEFLRIIELRKKCGLFILPQHLFQRQVQAICVKENCTKEECKDFGLNFICFVCNDLKLFIMKETTLSRHSNRLAKGSLRIVVDNRTETSLRYICGRRCERHQRHAKRKWKDSGHTALRKLTKEKLRDAVSNRCINTPLKEVDMIGHFLSYFQKFIFLCTECGNACLVNKKCFELSPVLNCGMCLQNKKKTCEKCFAVCACNNVLVLDTKLGRFRTGKLCASCSSLYASKQPIKL